MDNFEVAIDHELFRISERYQPSGSLSYDFAWLNGPAEGTYGFTVGITGTDSNDVSRMSSEELVEEARLFVEAFYGAGGIGAEDFPDHVPAKNRGGKG
ncbi:MAG: hypothetical protein L0J68_02670 [Micrococcaceae bacterium]|nr:hypothetical protein [Yaniella sp.]MDN5813074.1 hypothetical protein [Micrococcaceae bacterium]MDN6177278.1 hypothetical protein [Micrococcaceae bacterium]MDN6299179.1 hypothetical protein [Micrococcaceae bacterium]